jgi:hypothetical protein
VRDQPKCEALRQMSVGDIRQSWVCMWDHLE